MLGISVMGWNDCSTAAALRFLDTTVLLSGVQPELAASGAH